MSLFAIRDYRHLFSAQVIALFGTGLATVALGLLAYDLAGAQAGAVLGTALTIKMVMYVLVAPVVGAYADRLPRRMFLTLLDAVRAGVVLALPFVTEIWQIYLLVGLLQAASAAFTPTFQATIPDIVPQKADYTRALSASQVAYTMESLLSPVLAAVALTFMSFNWLFVGTSAGFLVSAALVLSTRIPDARPSGHTGVWARVASGSGLMLRTTGLRGVLALNLVVAAAGAIVVVNTVNYVRDQLGGTQADVAWMLAASGLGTLVAALMLPRVLDSVRERSVMMTGAVTLLVGVLAAVTMSATGITAWGVTAPLWALIGAGMALIVTPTGRVIRGSVEDHQLPAVFAAQFSLSHAAWLVTYPIAGWLGTAVGLTPAWATLALLALAGLVSAWVLWPRRVELPASVPEEALAPPAQGGHDPSRPTEAEASEGMLAACQCAAARAV
ncbi:MFS transporter [Nesterenkonia sp. PF2B19]|uniref:MFS transporter n=1 Tax=Nesterenkonia sp. PF2B19 TaxID=1881858 RepID=UPI000A19B868|nr:MFS transporter [Nesterenkonia sp. PF2B19]OSM42255.1 MFS transporter [Nesterenkonia sp. PF2B19]